MTFIKQENNAMIYRFLLAAFIVILPMLSNAKGFDSNYEVYSNDFNGDGLTDLYLRQKPQIVLIHGEITTPILIPPPIDSFILQQNADSSFTVETNVSAVDLTVLQPESVTLSVSDFNVDGFNDLLIKNINEISNLSNISDQIIYSPSESASLVSKSFDTESKQFFNEAFGWINDDLYFEKSAINNGWYDIEYGDEKTGWWYISYINIWYTYGNDLTFLDEDDDPSDENNTPNFCIDYPSYCLFDSILGSWMVYGTFTENNKIVYDYSHFNQDALRFAELYETYYQEGEMDPNSTAGIETIAILEKYFGDAFDFDWLPDFMPSEVDNAWDYIRVTLVLGKLGLQYCALGYDDEGSFDSNIVLCFSEAVSPVEPNQPCLAVAQTPYVLTSRQQSLSNQSQRREFWLSRGKDSCDPVAWTAMTIIEDIGIGRVTNRWLRKVAEVEGVSIDEEKIGVQLMQAHANYTKNDNISIEALLSAYQVAKYHHTVFDNNGLPSYTFGGTPFGTSPITNGWLWCQGCDSLPR